MILTKSRIVRSMLGVLLLVSANSPAFGFQGNQGFGFQGNPAFGFQGNQGFGFQGNPAFGFQATTTGLSSIPVNDLTAADLNVALAAAINLSGRPARVSYTLSDRGGTSFYALAACVTQGGNRGAMVASVSNLCNGGLCPCGGASVPACPVVQGMGTPGMGMPGTPGLVGPYGTSGGYGTPGVMNMYGTPGMGMPGTPGLIGSAQQVDITAYVLGLAQQVTQMVSYDFPFVSTVQGLSGRIPMGATTIHINGGGHCLALLARTLKGSQPAVRRGHKHRGGRHITRRRR